MEFDFWTFKRCVTHNCKGNLWGVSRNWHNVPWQVRAVDVGVPVEESLPRPMGGTQLHPCNICGKLFNRAYNLKKHLLTHTGERPFTCMFCPYRAALKGNVTKHMQARHPDRLPPPNIKLWGVVYVLHFRDNCVCSCRMGLSTCIVLILMNSLGRQLWLHYLLLLWLKTV